MSSIPPKKRDIEKIFQTDAALTGDFHAKYGHSLPMDPSSIEPGPSRQRGLRFGVVLGVAGLHAMPILMLVLYDLSRSPPSAKPEPGIPVIFEPAPNPAAAAPQFLAESTLHISMSQTTLPLSSPPRLSIPAVFRDQLARRAIPASASTSSSATARKLAAPMQKSVHLQPAPDVSGVMASWEGRIREAVQEAAVYPASARMLHHTGRAQVRFTYDLGTIKDASVAQTSRFVALDSAALTAVTAATIPPAPTELGPQKRTMLVWIQFSLTAQE